jgi:hypothetical protein
MITVSECQYCFYVPGQTHIVDIAIDGRSHVNGETLEQVQQRHPGAVHMLFDEAIALIRQLSYERYISAPTEITKERWWEMLEILPPIKWRHDKGFESFMISEALTMDLRSIYCRIGDRYFEMTNRQSLTHEEITEMCLPLLATP